VPVPGKIEEPIDVDASITYYHGRPFIDPLLSSIINKLVPYEEVVVAFTISKLSLDTVASKSMKYPLFGHGLAVLLA